MSRRVLARRRRRGGHDGIWERGRCRSGATIRLHGFGSFGGGRYFGTLWRSGSWRSGLRAWLRHLNRLDQSTDRQVVAGVDDNAVAGGQTGDDLDFGAVVAGE